MRLRSSCGCVYRRRLPDRDLHVRERAGSSRPEEEVLSFLVTSCSQNAVIQGTSPGLEAVSIWFPPGMDHSEDVDQDPFSPEDFTDPGTMEHAGSQRRDRCTDRTSRRGAAVVSPPGGSSPRVRRPWLRFAPGQACAGPGCPGWTTLHP